MAKGQYEAARAGFSPSSDNAAPFGLRAVPSGNHKVLVIDEREAEVIGTAAGMLVDEGRDLPDVCRTLDALGLHPRKGGYWHPENLRKLLVSPHRMGVVTWGRLHPDIERYGPPTQVANVCQRLPRHRQHGRGQRDELASVGQQAARLRERMTSQVAGYIRLGTDPAIGAWAVAQLESELAVLEKRADSIRWAIAEGEAARERVTGMESLARRAAGRLDQMTLDERRDVLALLDVHVRAGQDGSLHVTGTVRELDLPGEPQDTGTKVLHSHGPPGNARAPTGAW